MSGSEFARAAVREVLRRAAPYALTAAALVALCALFGVLSHLRGIR